MPRDVKLSNEASADIDAIWEYTAETYTVEQAQDYLALIEQGLEDIEQFPEGPTSLCHPELGESVRSYHIALSKKRSGTRIRSPRHVIYYTLKYHDKVLVLRILKDDMDVRRHLPKG